MGVAELDAVAELPGGGSFGCTVSDLGGDVRLSAQLCSTLAASRGDGELTLGIGAVRAEHQADAASRAVPVLFSGREREAPPASRAADLVSSMTAVRRLGTHHPCTTHAPPMHMHMHTHMPCTHRRVPCVCQVSGMSLSSMSHALSRGSRPARPCLQLTAQTSKAAAPSAFRTASTYAAAASTSAAASASASASAPASTSASASASTSASASASTSASFASASAAAGTSGLRPQVAPQGSPDGSVQLRLSRDPKTEGYRVSFEGVSPAERAPLPAPPPGRAAVHVRMVEQGGKLAVAIGEAPRRAAQEGLEGLAEAGGSEVDERVQALATKLSDAKETLAAAAPQGIASEERLQAELREVTTQLR